MLIRALGVTLRYEDVLVPGTSRGDLLPPPTVFAFWHRSLLCCAYRFRGMNIAILVSRSFDGELIARTVERLGFTAIRGSSSRGGAMALRKLAEAYARGQHCVFTADGPRGPAMVAKPGPVQLAALVQAPWIGTFYAVPDRAWVLKSWDRFLIPKPFATVKLTWPAHAAPDHERLQAALDEAVRLAGPEAL